MKRTTVAMIAATFLVAGCAGGRPTTTMPSAGSTASLPTYNYALSGGDKVRVNVYGEQALGGDYTISGSGNIALPLIGEVNAKGLTSSQLQQRIATRLADGYIKEPRVAVEVLTTRPFYILGEVNRPGQYSFANGLTIEAAVAQAGGYTYRAKTKQVMIKHDGEDAAELYALTPATLVMPGDTIQIRERWF